jgi:hypothetical protein
MGITRLATCFSIPKLDCLGNSTCEAGLVGHFRRVSLRCEQDTVVVGVLFVCETKAIPEEALTCAATARIYVFIKNWDRPPGVGPYRSDQLRLVS